MAIPTDTGYPVRIDPFSIEPDDEWKTTLRARIEGGLSSMVERAKRDKEDRLAKLADGETDPGERQRIEQDYEDTMKSFRRLAEEQFREQLDRELRKRRARVFTEPDSDLTGLIEEQRLILEDIQRKRVMEGADKRNVSGGVPSHNDEPIAAPARADRDAHGGSRAFDRTYSNRSVNAARPGPQSHSPSYIDMERGPDELADANPPSNARRQGDFAEYYDPELEEQLPRSYGSQSGIPGVSRKQSSSSLSSTRQRPEVWHPNASEATSRAFGYAHSPSPISPMRRDSFQSGSFRSGIASTAPQGPSPPPPAPPPPSPLSHSTSRAHEGRWHYPFDEDETAGSQRDTAERNVYSNGREIPREDARWERQRSPSIRRKSSASDFYARSRPQHSPSPISPSMSPDIPRTPDHHHQPSSYTSSSVYRRPDGEERVGIPIPMANRAHMAPQGSPEFPRYSPAGIPAGRPIVNKRSFTVDDRSPFTSPSPSAQPWNDFYNPGSLSRRNSVGSYRSETFGRADEYTRRPLPMHEEMSGTDTDDDFIAGCEDAAFDVEALLMRQEEALRIEKEAKRKEDAANRRHEEARKMEEEVRLKEQEAKRREEEAQRKEEEARRRAEEAKQKEEEAKRQAEEASRQAKEARRKEEKARQQAEEAARKREEAYRIELEARRKEEETKRREEELRQREEEVRRREEEMNRRENEARVKEEERRRAEILEEQRQREEEVRRREEEVNRRENEARAKEEERRRAEILAQQEEKRKAEDLAREKKRKAREEQAFRNAEAQAMEERLKAEAQVEEQRYRVQEAEAADRRRIAAEELRRHTEADNARRKAELEAEDRRLAEQIQEEEVLKAAQQEEQRRAEALAQHEFYRERLRNAAERKRQDSMGSSDHNRSPISSASNSSGPWPIPNRTGSTSSSSSDRTSATSSSWGSTAGSVWSGVSSTTSTQTSNSNSSRTSTTPTGAAKSTMPSPSKPPSSAWKRSGQASAEGPTSNSTSPPKRSAPPRRSAEGDEERAWKERQEEQARKQAEAFQREQERLERQRQDKEAKVLDSADVVRLFQFHDDQWKSLLSMEIISWDSVPWPILKRPKDVEDLTTIAIGAYVLNPNAPGAKLKSDKERVKDFLLRWHPDRFETRFMPKVREDEREKVKDGAGAVARALSELLTRASSPMSIFT